MAVGDALPFISVGYSKGNGMQHSRDNKEEEAEAQVSSCKSSIRDLESSAAPTPTLHHGNSVCAAALLHCCWSSRTCQDSTSGSFDSLFTLLLNLRWVTTSRCSAVFLSEQTQKCLSAAEKSELCFMNFKLRHTNQQLRTV